MPSKHIQAQKKVTKAVSAFDTAIVELKKATELTAASVLEDAKTLESIEQKVASLWVQHDQVQADMLGKKEEIKKQLDLADKLAEFTL